MAPKGDILLNGPQEYDWGLTVTATNDAYGVTATLSKVLTCQASTLESVIRSRHIYKQIVLTLCHVERAVYNMEATKAPPTIFPLI